jgi:hypothetical protein
MPTYKETPDLYFEELSVVESLFAFHPDFFADLSADEREALRLYYGLGESGITDIVVWRTTALAADSDLEARAPALLRKTLAPYGIRFDDEPAA